MSRQTHCACKNYNNVQQTTLVHNIYCAMMKSELTLYKMTRRDSLVDPVQPMEQVTPHSLQMNED